MSIIGKNLGDAKKHNGQILEHNRHRPNSEPLLWNALTSCQHT